MSPVPRGTGARTPEELEALLEDGLLMREREAVVALFDESAVLIPDHAPPARGHAAIGRSALAAWSNDRPYLADPHRIVQARDIALIVTAHGINVARRGRDGTWRYAIVVAAADAAVERIRS
jgi:hypothetical protein